MDPTSRRKNIPDFSKLHQKWNEELEKRKAYVKRPCTTVKEFHLSKQRVPSSVPTKRHVLGQIQPAQTTQTATSLKRKPAQSILKFPHEKGHGVADHEPSPEKIAKFRPSRIPSKKQTKTRFDFKADSTALNSILNNKGLDDPKDGFKFRPSRVPLTTGKNLSLFDFVPDPKALESIMSNRGLTNPTPSKGVKFRPSRVPATDKSRHLTSSIQRQSIYARIDHGIACTPARYRSLYSTPSTVAMGAGIHDHTNTRHQGRDNLSKKLFAEDEENEKPESDDAGDHAGARPGSTDGEQTKILFRQRKVARSPKSDKSRFETEQKLKLLEKREKAMKLKIHLQELQRAKERTKLEQVEENEFEHKTDLTASPTLERKCQPMSFTKLDSDVIDDVIGLTVEEELNSDEEDHNVSGGSEELRESLECMSLEMENNDRYVAAVKLPNPATTKLPNPASVELPNPASVKLPNPAEFSGDSVLEDNPLVRAIMNQQTKQQFHFESETFITGSETVSKSLLAVSGTKAVIGLRSAFTPLKPIRVDEFLKSEATNSTINDLNKCDIKTFLVPLKNSWRHLSLDDEVAYYTRDESRECCVRDDTSSADRPRNPIVTAFLLGTDTHFVPLHLHH